MSSAVSGRELRRFPLFDLLNEEEAELLAQHMKRVFYDQQSIIFEENTPGDTIYLIVSGEARVLKETAEGAQREVAVITEPAVFGEMAVLTDELHSATIQASTELELLTIHGEHIEQLLERNSLSAYKLMSQFARILAHRLRTLNTKMAEVLQENPAQTDEDQLANLKQKLLDDWSF